MVAKRCSRVQRCVAVGIAVLVLSGSASIRAQESVRQRAYTPLVSAPAHTAEAGHADQPNTIITLGLGPPPNLLVPSSHHKLVRMMWEQSPSFRRQCERIARESMLTVRVHLFAESRAADATTRLVNRPGSGLEANVYLGQPTRVIELFAHELEHVIERLEGIDVGQVARRLPDQVWITGDGIYETRRAIHSGRTVASEVTNARKSRW